MHPEDMTTRVAMPTIQEALRAWRQAERNLVELRESDAPHGLIEAAVRELAHARREYESVAVRAFDLAVPVRRRRTRHASTGPTLT
jgi:hypothetical protein